MPSPGQDATLLPWLLAGVMSVIGALSSAVVYIFKRREWENTETLKELKIEVAAQRLSTEKCEDERNTLFSKCAVFESQLNYLSKKVASIDRTGTQHSQDMENGNDRRTQSH